MTAFFSAFLDLFHQQITVLEQLLSLGQRKGPVLIEGDLEALNEIVREEQELVLALGNQERKRLELVEQFGVEGLDSNALSERCPAELKEPWLAAHERCRQVISELEQVNQTNRELIETALSVTEFTRQLLMPAPAQPGTYGKDGRRHGEGAPLPRYSGKL